jgi:cytochrome c peroxidase
MIALSMWMLVACEGPAPANDAGTTDGGSAGDELEILRTMSGSDFWVAPPDASNAFADDDAAARLGQRFFFDPSFSGPLLDTDNDGTSGALGLVGETGKVACASCHVPEAGFLDDRSHGRAISLGAGWGTRRAPSLLNVGHARLLMWDGRHDAAYNQVLGPIEASFELNGSRLFTAQQIFRTYRADYEAIFGPMPPLDDASRFPQLAPEHAGCESLDEAAVCHGKPGDGREYDSMSADDQRAVTRVVVNFGKAISAYTRRLTCGPGRFDAWIAGDETALTEEEKAGARLFVGRAGCVACHSGPLMSDQRFHNVGLAPGRVAYGFVDADDHGASIGLAHAMESPLNVQGEFSDGDDGRLPESVPVSATGAFRTPQLRCVSMRLTFMHTGQLNSLEGVVRFFNRGGDASGYPGVSENAPRGLSDEEEDALVAFLEALDGELPPAELLAPP